jgi:putative membrane protein
MRLAVAVPLAVAVVVFLRGAWRLRRGPRPGIGAARLLAAAVGFTAAGLALSEPVHVAAHLLFSAHMVQHLLLVSIAAPALLLADPCAAMLWGLPHPARRATGRLLAPGHPVRRALTSLTRMTVAWPAYVLVLWLWHLPAPYEAALRNGPLHDVEHVLFFGTAVLFWWPALGAAPRLGPPPHPAARVAYLVLGAVQSAALGLLLSTRSEALYPSYAATAPGWGLTGSEDQALGGVLMWSVGAAIDMAAVLYVLWRVLSGRAFLDRSAPMRDNLRA